MCRAVLLIIWRITDDHRTFDIPGRASRAGEPSADEGTTLPAVLCAGLSCVDHIWQVERFPPEGSRTDAQAYRSQGGGPAATAAVTVARLGGAAHLWAIHGDDPAGALALSELRDHGVAVDAVRLVPGASSWVSAVLVEPSGERYIFPYRGRDLEDAPPPETTAVPAVGAVLVDFRHPRLCQAALDLARAAAVPTIGDVGNSRCWQATEALDVLIASEECAAEVLGRSDPAAALGAMRWRPDQTVGVTLGPEGYLWDAGEGVHHLPALPVDAVDTTGAGDVFHGAYAFGVAAGWNIERCSEFALVCAGLSCSGPGRSAIPDRWEVEERLREYRSDRPEASADDHLPARRSTEP